MTSYWRATTSEAATISRFSPSGQCFLRRFAFVSTSHLLDPSKTGVSLGHHPHPRKAVPTGGRRSDAAALAPGIKSSASPADCMNQPERL